VVIEFFLIRLIKVNKMQIEAINRKRKFLDGMMDSAYFVGRVELLNWLNELIQLDYTKVEQTCSAAAFCQIMDVLYPTKVPLSKVNYNAKLEYEYVNNFKVLQSVFDKMGIDKHIDVPKLVKGKYQDNLEFLQWIKRYFELHYDGQEYNALERRRQCKCIYLGDKGKQGTVTTLPITKESSKRASIETSGKPKVVATTVVKSSGRLKVKSPEAKEEPQKEGANKDRLEIAALKVTVDGLEKERDFYFGKLREIEILGQQSDPNSEIVKGLLRILYATDDAEEFVAQNSEQQSEMDDETY